MQSKNVKSCLLAVCLLAGLLSSPFSVSAAGFDCNKAGTTVEKMICTNSELSNMDEELSKSYKHVLDVAPDKEAVKQDQRAWIKKRNQINTPSEMTELYQQRVEEFKAMINNGATGSHQPVPAPQTSDKPQQANQAPPQQPQSVETQSELAQQKPAPEPNQTSIAEKNKSSSSVWSTFTTILYIAATIIIVGILIYFFGARTILGGIVLIIASFTEAPAIRKLGEAIKGIDSGKSLLNMAMCRGKTQHGSCDRVLLKCTKCGAIGCDYCDDNRCSNQMFISHKCEKCGTYVAPEKDWISGS